MLKVLLINGSSRPQGCTYTALNEIIKVLEEDGIETEFFQTGKEPIRGCTACRGCSVINRYIFDDDPVNAVLEKAEKADGFVFGSPVHYGGPSGNIKSLLDRVFYSARDMFFNKPGAVVVSARRGGASAALDQLNKYLTGCGMIVVSSQYWNMVHGNTPEEVRQDLEGMQTCRTLGRNMAWLLKCIQAGKEAGIQYPVREPRVATNFIR